MNRGAMLGGGKMSETIREAVDKAGGLVKISMTISMAALVVASVALLVAAVSGRKPA